MRHHGFFILMSGALLATGATAAGRGATVMLKDAQGADRGTATLSESRGGLKLNVKAMGLPEGVHGIHLHAVGRCDAPDFATAGSHWNPTNHKHGTENPEGPHMGDMRNLTVGANGKGRLSTTIVGAKLTGEGGLMDADGAALVVHASADDYRTDPSGNSGGRIACGVVTPR